MTSPQFGAPAEARRSKRWQDAVNLVLAIWLFISPWVLQFANGAQTAAPGGGGAMANAGSAAWNAWVLGVVVLLIALSALGGKELWQEWINLVLGIWIFIAPWVLGFSGLPAAGWDHWIVGALVVVISAWGLSAGQRLSAAPLAHAGDKPREPRSRG